MVQQFHARTKLGTPHLSGVQIWVQKNYPPMIWRIGYKLQAIQGFWLKTNELTCPNNDGDHGTDLLDIWHSTNTDLALNHAIYVATLTHSPPHKKQPSN